jgi:hypothetical protein
MITRHRDFREYGGIIAVITLQGSSVFRVYDSPIDAVEWHTKPGQLVLLRGEGLPSAGKRCPPHEVDPPSDGERSIITLRCNSQGAGAGYKV